MENEEETQHMRAAASHAPALFCSSSRTTHMDIICTTNTPVRYAVGVRSAPASVSKRFRCKLPDATVPQSLQVGDPVAVTLTQTLVDNISRRRLNAAMHEERRRFMEELDRDRKNRVAAESCAAVVIQSHCRGGRVRRRASAPDARPNSILDDDADGSIAAELLALARRAGLVPMRGVTLAPKPRKSKKQRQAERHRQREEAGAARILQAVSRRRIATKKTKRLRSAKKEEKRKQSVSKIQRYYRGHLARLEVLKRRSNRAASTIQTRYRYRIASKQHSYRKHLFERMAREQHAAMRIQATTRARSARASFLEVLEELNPGLGKKKRRRRPGDVSDITDEPMRLMWQGDK
ncbi:hypothetical protein CTAYLR_001508 [Chrysophaeum taylorii]|uniref:Uncharacterized protein n=1 Tax=Chrysophaeum taylorii TaxID=2483200 RepID=A0AAD7UDA0_9STRA|nr:hypothetical protein CTAYLR_001508 [Chrysophaeum taylorii]